MSRFEQAVFYVIHSTSSAPEQLGRTKLAKVLFFADLQSFRMTGRPITEAVYERRDRGPMPRPLYDTIDRLERDGMIAQRTASHFGLAQHQFWALREPDLDELSATDVAILSDMTKTICAGHTATSISAVTHNIAWEVANTGEEIPFAAFLAVHGAGKATASEVAAIEAALGA